MVTATVLVIIDNIKRRSGYPNASHTPGGILILTLVLVVLVIVGAAYGGSLVFDHGVRVDVIRKVNKPQDKQQQTRLAATLAVLLSVPSVIRIKQLVALGEAEPAERRASSWLGRTNQEWPEGKVPHGHDRHPWNSSLLDSEAVPPWTSSASCGRNARRWPTIGCKLSARAVDHPKAYTDITIRHTVTGHNIAEKVVRHAIEFSEEKYCLITDPELRIDEAALLTALDSVVPGTHNLFKQHMHFKRFLHAADAMKEGAVRASLGIVSNAADVDAFVRFAAQFRDYQLCTW
jgi:hypothetical protein